MEIKVTGNVRIDIPAIDRLIEAFGKKQDTNLSRIEDTVALKAEPISEEPKNEAASTDVNKKPDYSHYGMFQNMLKAAEQLISVAPEKVGTILQKYTDTGEYQDVPAKDWAKVINEFKEATKNAKKATPTITIEDIRKAGRDYLIKHTKEEMHAILDQFGTKNVSGLSPDQYESFMQALQEEV